MIANSTPTKNWSSYVDQCQCDKYYDTSLSTYRLLEYSSSRYKVTTVNPDYLCDFCLTNTYPRPPEVNKCLCCRMIDNNMANDVWLCGDGSLLETTNFSKLSALSLNIATEVIEPIDEYHTPVSLTASKKPKGRWFSAGSWLYDRSSFYGGSHNCNNFDKDMHTSVVIIKKPKNILYVTNLSEFHDFILKYRNKSNDCSENNIHWDKVRNDGFYGVAFTFWHVQALGISNPFDYTKPEYNWHSGYEVESLVVWDYRAYDNKLYPVDIDLTE